MVEEKFCILFRAVIQADRKYESWVSVGILSKAASLHMQIIADILNS